MTKIYINANTKEWTSSLKKANRWGEDGYRVVWCYEFELERTLAKM